ncbi:MAG: chorismate synthase [Gemmatimonadaceae bacterium]
MLRFTTAGESHGPALVSILEGAPAGIPLSRSDIDAQLARRQRGYGRGRRMQIEMDSVELLAGVRAGFTIGSPVAMLIRNRDWDNWQDVMNPEADTPGSAPRRRAVTRPRPGHADLPGMLKYDREDARDILERASARETTARVAAGAICRKLLAELGVTIGSHLVELGGIEAAIPADLPEDLNAAADESPLRTLDRAAEATMIALIDEVKRKGDTLGGVCEVVCRGLPIGLGSHVSWDRKLDGRIAAAMMSIHAVKGVGIGIGFEAAKRRGSEMHDQIRGGGDDLARANLLRTSNRAGGIEGGITNGEPVVVQVAMKPISTLMRPLETVDMKTGGSVSAVAERSDVTAVPAMGVIAEAMLAFVVAEAVVEKFGGDSLRELKRNFDGYIEQIARH